MRSQRHLAVARVVNDAGRAFNVRLVRRGDRYSYDLSGDHYVPVVHEGDDPLVEFYDATYEDDDRFTVGLGQFVSRYFLSTLTGASGGIALCGHVPEWAVTAGNVADVLATIRALVSQEVS